MIFGILPYETTGWIAGGISTAAFALIVVVRLRGQHTAIKLLMQLAFGLLALSFVFRVLPLSFVETDDAYTYYFIAANLLTRMSIFVFSILLWELALKKRSYLKPLYLSVVALVGLIEFAASSKILIDSNIQLNLDRAQYISNEWPSLLYAIFLLPALLVGLYMLKLSVNSRSNLSRFKAGVIGLSVSIVAVSLMVQYVRSYFSAPQSIELLSPYITATYLFFFVMNSVVLLLEAKTSKGEKNEA